MKDKGFDQFNPHPSSLLQSGQRTASNQLKREAWKFNVRGRGQGKERVGLKEDLRRESLNSVSRERSGVLISCFEASKRKQRSDRAYLSD